MDRKNEKDWSPIHSGEQSLQIITLKAAQAYLCKVPVEVEVTVAEKWTSQPQLHDGVGCKM